MPALHVIYLTLHCTATSDLSFSSEKLYEKRIKGVDQGGKSWFPNSFLVISLFLCTLKAKGRADIMNVLSPANCTVHTPDADPPLVCRESVLNKSL